MRSGIVTLTTDFGLDDPFVGTMKGVILSRNPDCRIVDLTHGVSPGDRTETVLALAAAYPFFPRGTVHVAVVDPGVGSDRRILAAEAEGHLFLAPDSGLIPAILDPFGDREKPPRARYVSVEAQELFLPAVSGTFHGRDVFAPVAAGLALGLSLDALGPETDDPARFLLPAPAVKAERVLGRVIHIDRFGNLATNVRPRDLPYRPWTLRIAGSEFVGPAGYYWAVRPGELLALFGSGGFLEISVRDGNAADRLGAGLGTPVEVTRLATLKRPAGGGATGKGEAGKERKGDGARKGTKGKAKALRARRGSRRAPR
jgi:S-adenosylmethionine hydrolase